MLSYEIAFALSELSLSTFVSTPSVDTCIHWRMYIIGTGQ